MTNPKTLLKAVSAGRARQVRLLLDLGAKIDEQDECGQTPLIKAVLIECDRTREKIIKLLLNRRARVSQADVVGRNALMWACLNGDNNDVKLLIENCDLDLDFNCTDINGQTALFHAVTSGNAATVKLMIAALMKYSLSVDVTDYNGTSPLMQAQRLGYDVCESILVFEGHAKVRINHGELDNIIKREKWAISSLRDRSKFKVNQRRIRHPSQFPPISNKLISRGRTSPNRSGGLDSDGDESDSEDERNNSENCEKTRAQKPRSNIPALKVHQPVRISKSNIVTSAASTEVELSGGEDSEVDSVASTVIEPGKPVRPPMDLATIYSLKQEQMASSFRHAAVHIVEEPKREPTPAPAPEANKNKGKNVEVQKWKQLKRCLRLTGLAGKSKSCLSPEELEKQTRPGRQNNRRPSALPSIFSLEKKLLKENTATRY